MESIGQTLKNVVPVVAVEVAQEEGFTVDKAMSLMVAEESGVEFPVDLDNAWVWLGYSSKQACLKKMKNNCSDGFDFSLIQKDKPDNHAGLSPQELGALASQVKYVLTVECFKSLGMMAGTEQGKVIRQYFLDCERQAKQAHVTVTELLRRIKELEDAANGSAPKLALMAAGGDVAKPDAVLREEFPDLISNTLPPEVRQANLAEMQRAVRRGQNA